MHIYNYLQKFVTAAGPCVVAAQQLDESCVQHLQEEMLKEQRNMLSIFDSQTVLKMMAEFDEKRGSQSLCGPT